MRHALGAHLLTTSEEKARTSRRESVWEEGSRIKAKPVNMGVQKEKADREVQNPGGRGRPQKDQARAASEATIAATGDHRAQAKGASYATAKIERESCGCEQISLGHLSSFHSHAHPPPPSNHHPRSSSCMGLSYSF